MDFFPDVIHREVVWRSIKPCDVMEHRPVKLKAAAFNDPGRKPSVDRANFRLKPELSKRNENHGVVALRVSNIRNVPPLHKGLEGSEEYKVEYFLDVIKDPIFASQIIPVNLSHALIVTNPKIDSDKLFKRLRESLVRITETEWLVEPVYEE